MDKVDTRSRALESEVREELQQQGFTDDQLKIESMLNMLYDGTDAALMTLKSKKGWEGIEKSLFETYKTEFSFTLDKQIVVDDVRVKGIGKSYQELGESVHAEHDRIEGEHGASKRQSH